METFKWITKDSSNKKKRLYQRLLQSSHYKYFYKGNPNIELSIQFKTIPVTGLLNYRNVPPNR